MKKTQIKVDAVATEYDNDGNLWITFKVPMKDRVKARGIERVMSESTQQQQYGIIFDRYKQKRSLDANAYYWVLCGKLAEVMNLPPEEIYRQHIRDIGNFRTICMKKEAVQDFSKLWCSDHEGRLIETRRSKIPSCTTVLAYYGSSDFNTQQMSRLIDNCIQDCRSVGIETMHPTKLNGLLGRWSK